ncbi:MAG: DNA-3-methyladenine glycosylase [Armatimonadetes bacterium 13_1_40CM_64_14]|nr:MAG: DNA-3-methyladenine glycosylase [Armatimonadetes bacterium 13_1_40CM_64_14]
MARVQRCPWANDSALMQTYHDREWGTPQHGDRQLFEFLILEGMQAGLSWAIILTKRAQLRRSFAGFDAKRVARFDARAVRRLMADPRIIRNRAKIRAAITNARQFLQVQREFGSFDRYIWGFVGGRPVVARYRTVRQIPAQTTASEAMSADLRRRGFRFVGPTICYAFMQAVGMVNDHTARCFRRSQLLGKR